MKFNRRAFFLRVAKKQMSPTQVRICAGIANATLTKILNNIDYEPSLKVIGKLAAALHVEPQELLTEIPEFQEIAKG